MARILKGTKKYTYDATLKQLKTKFEDQLLFMSQTSVYQGVRERYLSINFETLRRMAQRLSIVSMIINTRQQQLTPFFSLSREIGQPGFVICKKGEFSKKYRRSKKNDKRADELTDFVDQTGFIYDIKREDDFVDFAQMVLRETLIIDQVAIELQRNRKGEVAAFWLIDGGTVRRCNEKGFEDQEKYQYVQLMEEQVVAAYTKEELVFDYMFKRVNIRYRGYGYSLLEQAVDLITTLILGISYNRDLFTKDKVPKGFIAIQGEADQEAINAVERYWYMAMTGAGAKFTIPILPSGKEGVSLDFKTLQPSNRDMEYYKLMNFFLSLFAGVFGMDLAELGIKTDTTQHIVGENLEGRIKYSKSRGIESLLGFIQGIMNKIIRKVDENYEFRFVGIDKEDEEKKYKITKAAVESSRTINEMRDEDGLEAKEGEEYDTVLNPQLIQLLQQLSTEEQQAEGGEEEYEEGEEEPELEEGEEEKEGEEEEEVKETKKSQHELEKHLDNLIKAGYDLEINV